MKRRSEKATQRQDNKMTRISVNIDEVVSVRAKRRALLERKSLAQLIQMLLQEYLDKVGED